ncbi:Uncharacterised protein [Vibrio cholerae]|nr:Uncharacterised protein [Vibrio cholerae]
MLGNQFHFFRWRGAELVVRNEATIDNGLSNRLAAGAAHVTLFTQNINVEICAGRYILTAVITRFVHDLNSLMPLEKRGR